MEEVFEKYEGDEELNVLLKILIPRNANRRLDTWLCKRPSSLYHSKEFERHKSYLKLPLDYPLTISTGGDERTIKELNNQWIAVVTGSEDFSFKAMRRNKYEEDLFDCEDERFEEDMLINTYEGCIELLEQIQEQAKSKTFTLQKSVLRTIRLKAIRDLYGDLFNNIIEALHSKPLEVIPNILTRLKYYKNSCLKHKERQNEIWKTCCEQNFYKSLDHRSFYFRQSEKKNTNSKGNL